MTARSASDSTGSSAPGAAPAVGPRIPGTVLVVEDSRVQRDNIAALCARIGVPTVLLAGNGAEALSQLEGLPQPPDAMIVDLEMPVMDGVQLIEALSQRGLQIPIVLASTQEAELVRSVETMARLLDMPQTCSATKPITEAVLREALLRVSGPAPTLRPRALSFTATDLDRALASGAIAPHYQPKICARSGVIRGVEALARWTDPELGHPTPDQFIACAEREGRIHALTMSIARQAVEQCARWNARGLTLSLAVNLSPEVASVSATVDELTDLVKAAGLPPRQIVFEVTEGAMVGAPATTLGVLNRLRLRGFGLSIDDYGTGFSSMERLVRVPWTELKIDRSFVHGVHRNARQRAVLQSAIDVATRLNIQSVAEGVETEEDWRLLQALGCTQGQGWLFSRALPGADLPAWLKQHAARQPLLRAREGNSGPGAPAEHAPGSPPDA